MFGPAGLPRDIVMKLSAVYNDALKQPEIVKSFSTQGMEPAGGTPEELARVMRSEYERWRKVIVAAKIEIEE
jgi:tripartite-type tricarboxylate transporter receptor subunit TctC